MGNLFYCKECRTILKNGMENGCCSDGNLKELVTGTSVNVIGTKIKGKIFKIKDDIVTLSIIDEFKKKFLRNYEFNKLRKVI